jgi:hypothetical protein
MTHLSEAVDLVDGLLTKSQKYIKSRPEEFRPIYNVYYMVIYVAIQDSFNYGKVRSKARNRTDYRYRNKRNSNRRIDARNWLLHSMECKMMWENISDVGYDILVSSLNMVYNSIKEETKHAKSWNAQYEASKEANGRLRGLSL